MKTTANLMPIGVIVGTTLMALPFASASAEDTKEAEQAQASQPAPQGDGDQATGTNKSVVSNDAIEADAASI